MALENINGIREKLYDKSEEILNYDKLLLAAKFYCRIELIALNHLKPDSQKRMVCLSDMATEILSVILIQLVVFFDLTLQCLPNVLYELSKNFGNDFSPNECILYYGKDFLGDIISIHLTYREFKLKFFISEVDICISLDILQDDGNWVYIDRIANLRLDELPGCLETF
jgi:hypothetical protein